MIPASIKFLGVKITLFQREELKEHLIQTVYDREHFRVLFLDEHKLFSSFVNPEIKKVIQDADIVLCSSGTVAWMVKFLTGKTVPVILPVTIFLDFMRTSDEMNYSLFFFGGNTAVAGETLKRMKKSFPQARVLGSYRSNIKSKELEDVLTTIRKSSPQIFISSLGGNPKQELWLTQNQSFFPSSIVLGVDDSFRIIAGKRRMPPRFFQEKGWNGFYTFLTRPYDVVRLFRVLTLFFFTLYKKIRIQLKKDTVES